MIHGRQSLDMNLVTKSGPVLDTGDLLERIGGDGELLAELAAAFHRDSPQQAERLRSAVALGDAREVTQAAHSLKGALASLGAVRARALASELEQMGKRGDLAGAAELCAALEREIVHVGQALEKLCVEVSR